MMNKKIVFIFLTFYQFIYAYSIPDYSSVYSGKDLKTDFSETIEKNAPFMNSQQSIDANQNIIYLSPYPNSKFNSPATNIIIRTKNLAGINSAGINNILSVVGFESGPHSGKITIADDNRTILFKPDIPFSNGESVTVKLNDGLTYNDGSKIGGTSFNFSVSLQNIQPQNSLNLITEALRTNSPTKKQNVSSADKIPDVTTTPKSQQSLNLPSDFPYFSIQESNQSPGEIFLDNITWTAGITNRPYIMILDNTGAPFFYKKTLGRTLGLTLQPNGMITYYDESSVFFYGMNSAFAIIDSFHCGNGYLTDVHELKILPNGHFLLIGDDYEQMDMSQIVPGGDPQARVVGMIIQELDQNKNVVFQWRSWDHFNITDATSDINLLSPTIDYAHINAIELDTDGNILISSRHLDEITKIDRQTGEIIWRLGGKNNQFQFINDNIGFSHQHDIRRLSNGDISMFDDGNLHSNTAPSRAVEYKLDEINKTATLVWSYSNSPGEYSSAMGNVQHLSNGNSLIGWGMGSPAITEVTPSGHKLFELTLAPDIYSYRAFKFNLSKAYYASFVPNLIYPNNGISLVNNKLTFVWNRNKFAQSFHLQVATDSAFTNIICDITSLIDTSITFNSFEPGNKYYWHVASNNNSENIGGFSGYSDIWSFTSSGTTAVAGNDNLPTSFNLSQNYPNPFNPTSTIQYDIPKTSLVNISVFDMLGRQIKVLVNEQKTPGHYETVFDAKELASGIYIYRINTESFTQSKKMILMK
jgi:hypothetical protein